MRPAPRIVGLLLAAGRGTRFGGDKLLAPLVASGTDGSVPVAVASCSTLVSVLTEVVAVVRPDQQALERALEARGARVLRCPSADQGMAATLVCGVRAVPDADGWIVALADMPWVRAGTIRSIADALCDGAGLAAPFHRGIRGHPVGFGRDVRDELLALRGDRGARDVLQAHAHDMVRIDAEDPGVLRDVDTPADLGR